MGYLPIKSTTTLTARLTPRGRELYASGNQITKFTLGDSEAFYAIDVGLTSGEVPNMGGTIGPNASTTNSTGSNTAIRYPVNFNSLGLQTKSVSSSSVKISSTLGKISEINTTISGNDITQDLLDYNDITDSKGNLFASFGLPLNDRQKAEYSSKTFAKGGWSDTALSGLSANTILVIGVNQEYYGENLDGKEIKLDLETGSGTYTLYSTFQDSNQSLFTADSNYKDNSDITRALGTSLGFLMNDTIKPPNGDVSKSWATGFGDLKPFSVGKKERYNLRTDSNLLKTVDTVTGIAYLDKALLVITDQTIVGAYSTSFSGNSATTVTFNSVSTDVVQNITCIADRDEFRTSINPSWSVGDSIRFSELGLYNDNNQLMAIGKFDRHVVKAPNDFLAFGVKITI